MKRKPIHERDVLTSGDIAKLISVAPKTVAKWIDDGHLSGYRLPGSNRRRVTRTNLAAFLKKHDMPSIEKYAAVAGGSR